MKCELKKQCNIAALIGLNNSAGAAIDALRKIHPPAHVIIVSNRYEVYEDLVNLAPQLTEVEDDGQAEQVAWKH